MLAVLLQAGLSSLADRWVQAAEYRPLSTTRGGNLFAEDGDRLKMKV
jgi:hypothetical protein